MRTKEKGVRVDCTGVRTIGKIVKRKMTHRRIDLEASIERAVGRSSPPFHTRRCRRRNQENTIANTNTIGAAVVTTSVSWKLLSTKQLKGSTETSKFIKVKFPRNAVNSIGIFTGYSVPILDRICENVTSILYLTVNFS